MWLLALFIAVPLIEIALFIQVGGWLTLWPTLAIVVLTAIVGTWLVRLQGRVVMNDLRRSLNELNDPTAPLAHGAMILLSGALLLTPGFLTDGVGFALLIPRVRSALMVFLAQHIRVDRFGPPPQRPTGGSGRNGNTIIDAEYEDLDNRSEPGVPPGGRPSGWTRR